MDYTQLLFAATVRELAVKFRTIGADRHVELLGLVGQPAQEARDKWIAQNSIADHVPMAYEAIMATAVQIENLAAQSAQD